MLPPIRRLFGSGFRRRRARWDRYLLRVGSSITNRRFRKIHGRGPGNKAIVAAVLERGGKVLAKVVSEQTAREMIVLELYRRSLISSGKAANWQRGARVCPDAPTRNH